MLVIALMSCKKDKSDGTDPVISSFLVEGDTAYMVVAPILVAFSFQASDDEALQEYRFQISDEFGELELGGSSNYSYSFIGDLAGTSVNSGIVVSLHDSVTSGPYTCTFDVLDAGGNSADQADVELWVQNTFMPSIDLITYTNPVDAGDTIFLTGDIYDAADLEAVNITLYDPDGVKEYSKSYFYSDSTVTAWSMTVLETDSAWVIVDPASPAGTYTLHIEGKDTEANFDVLEHEITVN